MSVVSASERSSADGHEPRTQSRAFSRRELGSWILLLAAAVVAFARLGREPVTALNEAREGVYARAMIASGNWVLPEVSNHVENGETIPDKPPLFHWIAAAATWSRALLDGTAHAGREVVAGSLDEFCLRFPSALSACLLVLAFVLLGPGLVGRRAAWLAAATLITSWQFVNQSRYGRVDMCFACFTTWTMLLGGHVFLLGRRRLLLCAAVTAGLAVLSKGPLGLGLPALAFAVWTFSRGSGRARPPRIGWGSWILASLLFCAVCLPWYFAAYRIAGDAFVRSQLRSENLDQFLGTNGRMGFLYYLGPWLGDSFPWNLLALLAAIRAVRARDTRGTFCAIWWASFLLVFEVSAYKRGAYLLPALPAAALLAGRWLDAWIEKEDVAGEPRSPRPGWIEGGIVLAGLVGAALGPVLVRALRISSLVPFHVSLGDAVIATGSAGASLFAAVAAVHAIRHRAPRRALLLLFGALLVLYVGGFTTVLASRAEQRSPKILARHVEDRTPSDELLDVAGIGDDPSLLLLFHSRRPERLRVIPALAMDPARWPVGYYLFSSEKWRGVRSRETCAGSWRVILRDSLEERGCSIPVVLARKTPEGSETNRN